MRVFWHDGHPRQFLPVLHSPRLRHLSRRVAGSVWQAVHKETGELVAVKRMKRRYASWEECLALREVQGLRRLRHPCIVRLREVVRERGELFFIFEFMVWGGGEGTDLPYP